MKSCVLRDITPRSPLKANRRFGETRRIHFQSLKVSQEEIRMEEAASTTLFFRVGFFPSLHLNPENGREIFLRNVGDVQ
jgi:hypothetical protein